MSAMIDTPALAARRLEVLRRIAAIGDPARLWPSYRKCGKLNCHRASEGDGPRLPCPVASLHAMRRDAPRSFSGLWTRSHCGGSTATARADCG